MLDHENLFQKMFEQHDAIMLLIEPKTGQVIDANHRAVEFYGYAKPELTKKYVKDINILPEKEIAKQLNLALKSKENAFTFEHRLSNNEIRLVEVHSSPITIEGHKYLFSIIHDITQRKVDEDIIKRQANFLDTIMNNSPVAMWVSDAQGIVIDVNASLLKILNVPEQAVVGNYNILNDQNLVKQGVMPRVEAVFNDKETARFVIWWTGDQAGSKAFKNANSVWIDVSMVPIVDADNNLVNVICQWVNITDLNP